MVSQNIKTNGKPIYIEEFSKQNIIFLNDYFNTENEFKTNEKMIIYNLSHESYFKSIQFPKVLKEVLEENQIDVSSLVLLDHQLLKSNRNRRD